MKYDFSGWATKNNIKCSDGRTIRENAFKHCDGKIVPLVWNHGHNDVENVLGNVLLKNRPEGVYAYGTFNNGERGQLAKELIQHGDIVSLSICANKLKETSNKDVLHGDIREVSLVLAGANDGAKIDNIIVHNDEDNSMEFFIGQDACSLIMHAEQEEKDNEEDDEQEDNEKDDERSIGDIIDTMNDDQKKVLYYLIGKVQEDKEENNESEEGEEEEMKHNVFDKNEQTNENVLTHDDGLAIIELAKRSNVGSLQEAIAYFAEENDLQHDAISSGFATTGDGNVTELFPDYQDVRPGAPELVTNDQGWISNVMSKVHKSPISRIRTRQVDIRNIDELRAKGYTKGKKKSQAGNFSLVRRTTDPQTVYVKNALHRDDIVDITDFDYVKYLYDIDRMMLNEELAMAIMLGDGRDEGADDKIAPTHIRPIWLDDELYTLHADLDLETAKEELQGTNTNANFGENYITTEAMIQTVLHAREKYKGSGTPDFYCTPRMLNIMLLARDLNGRRIYSSKAELASALNVGDIYTAEQFEGKTRTTEAGKKKKLDAIIVNLADYSLGATKGGEVTHFTQFDIDFNQEKSLLETRCSGALTRVYSAIAIEEDVTDVG